MNELENLIERVARAICAADGTSDPDEFGRNVRGEETYGWQMWEDESKAAIIEMEKWRGEQLAKVKPFKTDLEAFINHSLPDRSSN